MSAPHAPVRRTSWIRSPVLSAVYLDNRRIGLLGDPMPRVAKILAASGMAPGQVQVLRGRSATDPLGKPLRADDLIDRRIDPARPIYLTSAPVPGPAQVANQARQSRGTGIPAVPVEWPPEDEGGPRPLGTLAPGVGPDPGPQPRNPMPSEDRTR